MFEHLIKQYFIKGSRERIIRRIGAETVKVTEKVYYCRLCSDKRNKVYVRSKSRAIRHLEKIHGMNLNLTLNQFSEG